MTVPGYHVLKEEEDDVSYSNGSPFSDPDHKFRKELEERRLSFDESGEVGDGEIANEEDVSEEFVEQVKKDAEKAPKAEETIPEEESPLPQLDEKWANW